MMTRREAFRNFFMLAAASPLAKAQLAEAQQPYLGEQGIPLPVTNPDFIPPLEQMADVFDFETVLRRRSPRLLLL
jgi:hypothetical protein